MFRLPVQQQIVRRILLSDDGTPDQLDEGWRELFLCDTRVLAARVREVLRVDVRSQLARINVPSLYLQATRDRVVPPWCLRDIRQALPGLDVVRIDAPHPILQRRAAKSAAAVVEFLERIR
jgi:pimeloyl-ACP methyl ester carboxylesterase